MRTTSFRGIFAMLALAAALSGAHAANVAIDPDPRSPSLGDLLAREEAARMKAQPLQVVESTPAQETPPSGVSAPKTSGPRTVRQVYPSPYAGAAVTVLVPGGRLPAPR